MAISENQFKVVKCLSASFVV